MSTEEVKKGLFIALAGPDGSGKTTHAKYIYEQLNKHLDGKVILTREPGGTPAAEELRSFILAPREENFPVDCEILLFYAARLFHIENKIKPVMAEGKIVISDRFNDCTFAYQCSRGVEYEKIKQIDDLVLNGFHPDITFFFFVPPEVSNERTEKRGDKDRISESSMSIYFRRMNESQSKYLFIDSSKEIEYSHAQIDRCIESIVSDYLKNT